MYENMKREESLYGYDLYRRLSFKHFPQSMVITCVSHTRDYVGTFYITVWRLKILLLPMTSKTYCE